MPWLDLDDLDDGYLYDWHHARVRQIANMERIAHDLRTAHIRVRWGRTPAGQLACAYLDAWEIVLSPWLFRHDPWVIRYVLTHEDIHIETRSSNEDAIREWQVGRYGDIIEPLWIVA